MKKVDRQIVVDLIGRIESDNFSQIEVRTLFMILRAYSRKYPIFTEIAHFVAHNDVRDSGISNVALLAMKLRMKFFIDFVSNNKRLDITKPFRLWIKRLIILQVDRTSESILKQKFKLDRAKLKQKIHLGFHSDKKSKTVIFKKSKISNNSLKAVEYVMSFIYGNSSFNQNSLMDEIFSVLREQNIGCNESEINKVADKFTICVMLLMHNVSYIDKPTGNDLGTTKIGAEKTSILHEARFVDKDGNEIENPQSFGELSIHGAVEVENNGKPVTFLHSIMSTNLKAIDWCDDSLFKIETLDYSPPNVYKTLSLDCDLSISDEFKLVAI